MVVIGRSDDRGKNMEEIRMLMGSDLVYVKIGGFWLVFGVREITEGIVFICSFFEFFFF